MAISAAMKPNTPVNSSARMKNEPPPDSLARSTAAGSSRYSGVA